MSNTDTPETKAPTSGSIDKLRRWRDEYRASLMASPLEDVNQLSAKLDLTHAHPSGISQLFASGSAPLHSLFRDSGMPRAAARRTERVLDDQSAKKRISGVAELSLVVGVATWKGNKMPVLLYPVEVVRDGTPVENHTTITFTGHVRLNSAFLNAMRENGVNLDERALFDGSNYASGTPETAAVFAVITKAAQQVFADFSIERQIILGCFVDPSTQILMESRMIIERLARIRSTMSCSMPWPATRKPSSNFRGSPFHRIAPSTATPLRIRGGRCRQHRALCRQRGGRRPFAVRRRHIGQRHRRAGRVDRLPVASWPAGACSTCHASPRRSAHSPCS